MQQGSAIVSEDFAANLTAGMRNLPSVPLEIFLIGAKAEVGVGQGRVVIGLMAHWASP